jgi:hypothetical protein
VRDGRVIIQPLWMLDLDDEGRHIEATYTRLEEHANLGNWELESLGVPNSQTLRFPNSQIPKTWIH